MNTAATTTTNRDLDPVVDVVVIGGGPAGLSAALVLGRANKKVLLCDAGSPRNASAEHMHGFLSRDGIPPSEFRRIAREQLRPYDVTFRTAPVVDVTPVSAADGFVVRFADGGDVMCRRVILALGMVDEIPGVAGIRDHWGRSVFLCPYCHGWEVRDRPWGMLATEPAHLEFAAFLTGWTRDVVAFWHGTQEIPAERLQQLADAGVRLERRRVARVVCGSDGTLEAVALEDGHLLRREVLVVRPVQRQAALVRRLGLALDEKGFVLLGPNEETSIRGIFAAGDLTTPVQGAQLAAAAGTRAAYAVNHTLNLARRPQERTHG